MQNLQESKTVNEDKETLLSECTRAQPYPRPGRRLGWGLGGGEYSDTL